MADLAMKRGDYRQIDILVTLGLNPYDLTGTTVSFAAKRNFLGKAVIRKSTDPAIGGITVGAASDGHAVVEILPTDTAGLEDELVELRWAAKVVVDGKPYTLDNGWLRVEPVVSV